VVGNGGGDRKLCCKLTTVPTRFLIVTMRTRIKRRHVALLIRLSPRTACHLYAEDCSKPTGRGYSSGSPARRKPSTQTAIVSGRVVLGKRPVPSNRHRGVELA
jgi:hypothetical protein